MWTALLLFACSGSSSDGPSDAPPTEPTADTGATGPTGDTAATVDGLCSPTDHALRFTCPAVGLVRWWPEGEPERERSTTADGEALLWGMPAGVTTIVELPDGRRTRIDPGLLPVRIRSMSTTVSGTSTTRGVAVPNPCEGRDLLLLDDLGRVVWYQEFEAPVAAITITPDDTFLVLIGGGRVIELDVEGEALLNVAGFDRPLHHDLTRDDLGYTYVLNAAAVPYKGVEYVVDGLFVLDPAGQIVGQWDLRDHLDPAVLDPASRGYYWAAQFPDAVDFSHGNSVEASPDGGITLSFRWMHGAMHIVGDPTAPDFGEVEWVLGAPFGDMTSDFALVGDDPDFVGQHHVSVDDQGRVWLFDNALDDVPSRGMRFELDGSDAVVDRTWTLDRHCAIQGSTYPTSDDGALLTCSQAGQVREFGPDDTSPRWSLDLACDAGPRALLNRAVPVDF